MNRPLSSLEHLVWLIDRSVPQNFPMVIRLTGIPSDFEDRLRRALDEMQKKYPPLACKIDGLQHPAFVMKDVPPIPLTVVTSKNDRHWLDVMEREMNTPIPWQQGPLTRVNLLMNQDGTGCHLIVTFCHVVADATSGVTLFQDLLEYIRQMESQGENVPVEPRSPLPAPDHLLKKDLQFEPSPEEDVTCPMADFPGDENVPPHQRTTRIIQQILTPEETKKLVVKSKEEKTSVHGALCAAFMQAFIQQVRTVPGTPQEGPLNLGCVTPIDMRRHLSQDVSRDIGDFISQAIHYQPIDDQASFWETARVIKNSLQKEIKTGNDIKGILGAGQLLDPLPESLALALQLHEGSGQVVATNLGRLTIPEQFGNIRLEELHFAVGVNADGKNGFGIAVTTFRGRLTINFLFAEPYISAARARVMVDNTMERIKRII